MASEGMGLVPPAHRIDNGLNPQLVFQDDRSLGFSCGPPQRRVVGDPGPKTTRELTGFIDDRYFQPQGADFGRSLYANAAPDRQDHRDSQNWNGNGQTSTTPSGDGSDADEDEDDDEEDDDDDGDGEVDGIVAADDKNNSSNTSGHSSAAADKIGNGKSKHFSSFGSNREVLIMKECSIVPSGHNNSNNMRASSSEIHQQQGRVSQYQNAVTIVESDGDLCYSQYLQGLEAARQKDTLVENGCGFSGRKDALYSSESGESSLRAILSDPLTGALMVDAMILPCGHSFGGGGMQHVIRMKACCTCSKPLLEDSVAPNLSLRTAVKAFCREEELQVYRSSKRRREKFEQDKSNYGDSTLMDHPRGRGVQFPFSVTDRVIIKGNKRTPQRFVGREAVVMTQCLNGWYVVKTLDNAESVKLQYRSLAKVSEHPTSKPVSSKMTPNRL